MWQRLAKRLHMRWKRWVIARSGYFDRAWYLRRYPDVAAAGIDPLKHYLLHGADEDRDPSLHFSTWQYVQAYRAAIPTGENPLVHFVLVGQNRGYDPQPSITQPTPDHDPLAALTAWEPTHTPLVSVIMPVFNGERTIGTALDSVLAQTYTTWELIICDDGSTDTTWAQLTTYTDPRIQCISHDQRRGAAAARNTALKQSRGTIIAYLDADNRWHPRYLAIVAAGLERYPGTLTVYADYWDVTLDGDQETARNAVGRGFLLEDQIASPHVDLNAFAHRRVLYDQLGGFDQRLKRRQDYDLILRYTWHNPPLHLPLTLNTYQRIIGAPSITATQAGDRDSGHLIEQKTAQHYAEGLALALPDPIKRITVIAWDMSRNHVAKAFAVAEALSAHMEVELITFRFFDDAIYPPLQAVTPSFTLKAFTGDTFPAFFNTWDSALEAITGDAIYAIKPRLPSLGLALLAHVRYGIPIGLEVNDWESGIAAPAHAGHIESKPLTALYDPPAEALNPHSLFWTQLLDPLVHKLPLLYTHNRSLNTHYGGQALMMRNIKDRRVYDPSRWDRDTIRHDLGYQVADRVIIFAGTLREHKGIDLLLALLDQLDDARYKLLVIGSRETPALQWLRVVSDGRHDVQILPPQPPERIAAVHRGVDVVTLLLNPDYRLSHYQMPYKLTDALAMRVPVIATPVSDLAHLGDYGVIWTVPYGDLDALAHTLNQIFDNPEAREQRVQRGRKLFEREFSYEAVLPNLALGLAHTADEHRAQYPVAVAFASAFAAFRDRCLA